MTTPPILANKNPAAAALVREAQRQKNLAAGDVPPVSILDPDGEVVRRLRRSGAAKPLAAWPCYHSELDTFELAGQTVGIVRRAVGAFYAVLVAEQLFACGCNLLISFTAAGQIAPTGPTPFFVVIDRALRDEGTSYHYAAPSNYADADAETVRTAEAALAGLGPLSVIGASWTTDAPFREMTLAIEAARAKGVLAVETDAAAPARSAGVRDLCLAHMTNTMAQSGDDFEKGGIAADGTCDALTVLSAAVPALHRT